MITDHKGAEFPALARMKDPFRGSLLWQRLRGVVVTIQANVHGDILSEHVNPVDLASIADLNPRTTTD